MLSFVRLGTALSLSLALLGSSPRSAHALPDKTKPTATAKDKAAADKKALKNKAEADKKAEAKAREKAKRPKGPLSYGAPNAGKLYSGQRLPSSKSLEVKEGPNAWGLPSLVRGLRRAAARVSSKHRGSVLFVGELSAKNGGPLLGHNSHQSGRDADVGFYMVSDKGKHVNPHRFVAFGGNGRPRGTESVRFDDERNWLLIQTLLEDEKANVQHLFVSSSLRARLLAYAAKKNLPKDLLAKAAATLMSPKDGDTHDDHFHVRIACPPSMLPACVDDPSARTPAPAGSDKDSAKAEARAEKKGEAASAEKSGAEGTTAKSGGNPSAP
ncbi:penicillin-insensitive murein endopeptidase [Polyangium aurulentum]|uniref:penicillin-insensitive murein endopeptidase n=1 Tax=Polyangium aurulentum TaxID=2567896 RepID=UPI0010AE9533|nr:penicillin-insensitive murein endopeptidase [Polyangium aurulentum]UQA61615.1 penicillin-insensitive murein endopeptidase [Polyangium aurulentum]